MTLPDPDSRPTDSPLLRRWWWLPIVLLSVTIAVPRLFGEHWPTDSPYYQAISTEMAREGCWWTPMQGDLHYFNKPPLAFWIHGAMVAVFGDATWAAKAPEGVLYVLTCLVVGWLARRLHGPGTGMLAGCFLAMTSEWVRCIGNFRLEFLHTLLLLGACACWVEAFVPKERGGSERWRGRASLGWSVAAGGCIGGALMTKPLIGLAFPVLGLAWLGMSGQLTRRVAGLVLLSALVGVLVALPWHASMVSRYGETFGRAYFWEQSLQRATGERFHRHAWDWYFRLIAGGEHESIDPVRMWPIYGAGLAGLCVVLFRWRAGRTRAGDALAALWVVAWSIALCAFSGKQIYYLLVVHPGAAWLGAIAVVAAASWVGRRWATERLRLAARVAGVCARVALCGFGGWYVVSMFQKIERLTNEQLALIDYLSRHREEPIYNAGLDYWDAAQLYMKVGVWPRSIVEKAPVAPRDVPAGALMVYREDNAATPSADPADAEVFATPVGGSWFTVRKRHGPGDRP